MSNISSDDVEGLPCKQLANGCVGKMTRGTCNKEGRNEGKHFLACNDRDWHEQHPEFKSSFLWTHMKSDLQLYYDKAQKGFLEAPKPTTPKGDTPAPSAKRAAVDGPSDKDCRAVLIDIKTEIRSLHQTQSEMLEFFKTEFKRAKKSSEENDAIVDE